MKQIFTNIVKRFEKNSILYSSSIIFISSGVVNLSNLIFARLIAQNSEVVEYGMYVAVISFISVITIPATIVTSVGTKFYATFSNTLGDLEFAKFISTIRNQVKRYSFILSATIFTFITFFQGALGHKLSLSNSIIVSIIIFLTFMGTLEQSFIIGASRFKLSSFYNILSSVVKVVLVLLLIRTFGTLTSALTAILFTYLVLLTPRYLKATYSKIKQPSEYKFDKKRYLVSASFFSIALILFGTQDVLFLGLNSSPEQVALYGALATLGKIPIYFSTAFITVLLPFYSSSKAQGKTTKKDSVKPIFINGGILFLLIALFLTVPKTIISLLYPSSYYLVAEYLALYGILALLYSGLLYIQTYSLGMNRDEKTISSMFMFFAVIQAILLWNFGVDFKSVLNINIIVLGTLLLLTVVFLQKTKRI